MKYKRNFKEFLCRNTVHKEIDANILSLTPSPLLVSKFETGIFFMCFGIETQSFWVNIRFGKMF